MTNALFIVNFPTGCSGRIMGFGFLIVLLSIVALSTEKGKELEGKGKIVKQSENRNRYFFEMREMI